jgi:pyruvate dehydrogenase E2 component (dihydrolipoamide acetyltransferase)
MSCRAESAHELPPPGFVAVGGRLLRHRITRGVGDAVVFVHGFGGSLESWQENFAALAATGRTVAALDLPGHGESSLDVGSGSLEELADAVLGYLDALGLDHLHLVGHSMGAAVCLVLADRVPQRVRSLTLIGPAGIGQKINADFIRGYIGARSRVEIEPLMRLLYSDPRHVTEQLLQQALDYKQRVGVVEALTKIASSRYAGTPAGRQLRDVAGSVPTLVVWGADDAVIPPPEPGLLAREGVELHVLPCRGHMVQVEAADEVNHLIEALLRATA